MLHTLPKCGPPNVDVYVFQARVLRQRPEEWRRALQHLLPQALQQSDDKLLHTPYLQLVAMLDMQLLSFTP